MKSYKMDLNHKRFVTVVIHISICQKEKNPKIQYKNENFFELKEEKLTVYEHLNRKKAAVVDLQIFPPKSDLLKN